MILQDEMLFLIKLKNNLIMKIFSSGQLAFTRIWLAKGMIGNSLFQIMKTVIYFYHGEALVLKRMRIINLISH